MFSDSCDEIALRLLNSGRPGAEVYQSFYSSQTITANDWHFAALSYDNSTTTFYLDGQTQGSFPVTLPTTYTGFYDIPFGIGADYCSGAAGEFFNGVIDDLRIWNKSLSKAEIQAEMQSSSPMTNPIWSFEPSWMWSDGKFGKALKFDGVDDYVSVPTSTSIDSVGGMTKITVEAWVYVFGGTNNYQIVVMKGDLDAEVDVRPETNVVRWGITNVTGNRVVKDTNVGFVINKWFHLAITYDGSNINLYVNGTLQDSQPTTGNIRSSGTGILLGEYSNNYWFNGTIDSVRIFNQALTPDQIDHLYLKMK